ncbi:unnamed protein product, partial [Linum tenue]
RSQSPEETLPYLESAARKLSSSSSSVSPSLKPRSFVPLRSSRNNPVVFLSDPFVRRPLVFLSKLQKPSAHSFFAPPETAQRDDHHCKFTLSTTV